MRTLGRFRAVLGPASIVVAASTFVACGGQRAVPQPFPTARRPSSPSPPAEASPTRPTDPLAPDIAPPASAEPLTATALGLLGAPYRDGGADPRGFDCSGFVAYVYGQHGIALPRTVELQAAVGEDVEAPQAGDLVFFRTAGRGASHVGIALGPDRFIHAPSSRGVVRIEMLAAPYWAARYLETRRVLGH